VPIAVVAPTGGVAIALLCVAFYLLPQPKPRYKSGEASHSDEKAKA
jgi:hypothetical protein